MSTVFPVFHGTSIEAWGAVLGSVTRTSQGSETWVADQWLGFLKAGTEFIPGRWHRQSDLWAFAPADRHDVDRIRARPGWDVLDGYWGERAKLVLDRTHAWRKARVTEDTDHEHCAICSEKVGVGGQPEGYVNAQEVWVCEQCYTKFVEPGSLDFIPGVVDDGGGSR
jgi:hypothetical protein